jgi:hypothetical protein
MGMSLVDAHEVEAPSSGPPPATKPLSEREANARFAEVVLPHLDDAYALARWLTGNPADAEDVVQDGCMRAFRGIAGFTGGNARAWVLTIVRHTALRLDAQEPPHRDPDGRGSRSGGTSTSKFH